MPEIGLAGLSLDYPYSGSAVYARNLVRWLPAVAPDLRFHLWARWSGEAPVPATALATPFARLNRGAGAGARADKLAWEVAALPLAAARRRQSLIHSLYFAAPLVAPAPVVVTVHDLIPLILPDYHRGRASQLYSRLMAHAVRRATAIITVSQYSKRDITRVLGIPEERVYVTHEAADERFHPAGDEDEAARIRAGYGLLERYVLYLGGTEKRKNLETLVRAWQKSAAAFREREVRLVL